MGAFPCCQMPSVFREASGPSLRKAVGSCCRVLHQAAEERQGCPGLPGNAWISPPACDAAVLQLELASAVQN